MTALYGDSPPSPRRDLPSTDFLPSKTASAPSLPLKPSHPGLPKSHSLEADLSKYAHLQLSTLSEEILIEELRKCQAIAEQAGQKAEEIRQEIDRRKKLTVEPGIS